MRIKDESGVESSHGSSVTWRLRASCFHLGLKLSTLCSCSLLGRGGGLSGSRRLGRFTTAGPRVDIIRRRGRRRGGEMMFCFWFDSAAKTNRSELAPQAEGPPHGARLQRLNLLVISIFAPFSSWKDRSGRAWTDYGTSCIQTTHTSRCWVRGRGSG